MVAFILKTFIVIMRSFNINDLIKLVLGNNKDYIVALNKLQLLAGKNIDNNMITPFYTPFTVEMKKKKGDPYDRVTLLDTGGFYNSVFVDVFDSSLEIDATDSKTQKLKDKYAKTVDFFGLTDESIIKAQDRLLPELANEVEKKIEVETSNVKQYQHAQ